MIEPMWPMSAGTLGSLNDIDPANYSAELKYDGRRGQIVRTEDGVDIYSRSLKSQNGKCPSLEEAFMYLKPGTILDGEFVVFKDGKKGLVGGSEVVHIPNFTFTANVMGSSKVYPDGSHRAVHTQDYLGCKVSFVVFDVMIDAGEDVTWERYYQRRDRMKKIVNDLWNDINDRNISKYIEISWLLPIGQDTLDDLAALDAEGIMIKRNDGIYHVGNRHSDWLKLKFKIDHDVVITGFTEAREGSKYDGRAIGAVWFGQYREDGELIVRGKCGGMVDEIREDMYLNPDQYIGKVMTIKTYDPVPGSESFRMPQFKEFRDDKEANTCTWD